MMPSSNPSLVHLHLPSEILIHIVQYIIDDSSIREWRYFTDPSLSKPLCVANVWRSNLILVNKHWLHTLRSLRRRFYIKNRVVVQERSLANNDLNPDLNRGNNNSSGNAFLVIGFEVSDDQTTTNNTTDNTAPSSIFDSLVAAGKRISKHYASALATPNEICRFSYPPSFSAFDRKSGPILELLQHSRMRAAIKIDARPTITARGDNDDDNNGEVADDGAAAAAEKRLRIFHLEIIENNPHATTTTTNTTTSANVTYANINFNNDDASSICASLTSLAFVGATVSPYCLSSKFLARLPHLTSLRLVDCPNILAPGHGGTEGIDLSMLPLLTRLEVRFAQPPTPLSASRAAVPRTRGFLTITHHCPVFLAPEAAINLTHLHLSRCNVAYFLHYFLRHDSTVLPPPAPAGAAASSALFSSSLHRPFHRLEVLEVPNTDMDNACLAKVLERLHATLHTLDVSSCDWLGLHGRFFFGDSSNVHSSSSSQQQIQSDIEQRCVLQRLCMSHCEMVNDSFVQQVLQLVGRRLQELDLSNCIHLNNPTIRCESLRVLNLSSCEKLLSPTLHTPHLQSLNLARTHVVDSCLQRLFKNKGLTHHLHEMDLSGCALLRHPTFFLANSRETSRIRRLVMNNTNVKDDWVHFIASPPADKQQQQQQQQTSLTSTAPTAHLPYLESLELCACPKISSVHIRNATTLRELRLTHCPKLVEVLLEACPSLEVVCVSQHNSQQRQQSIRVELDASCNPNAKILRCLS